MLKWRSHLMRLAQLTSLPTWQKEVKYSLESLRLPHCLVSQSSHLVPNHKARLLCSASQSRLLVHYKNLHLINHSQLLKSQQQLVYSMNLIHNPRQPSLSNLNQHQHAKQQQVCSMMTNLIFSPAKQHLCDKQLLAYLLNLNQLIC